MIDKFFRLVFRLYKRRLERRIDSNKWDPELSAKLDALLTLLGE